MLVARVERWEDVLVELLPLFPQHWKEVSAPTPLDMNFSAYRKMEETGALLVVGLRQGQKLVGYWILMLSPMLHSQSTRAAYTDLVFIQKDARGGGVGFSTLWKATREALVQRGVKVWFVGEKLLRPLGALFQKYGFTPHEMAYICKLGDG